MEQQNIAKWATVLNEARLHAVPVPQIGTTITNFSRRDAYLIQEHQMQQRFLLGEKQIGWKMGLTSKAKREQMNLDSPLYGFLTNQMQIENNGEFFLKGSIHPKIEPEIAFLMGQSLHGEVSHEQALAAVSAVSAALEILDSRYQQFKYFSMEDVISDNSSSSHFVCGPWQKDFRSLKLDQLTMSMTVNGTVAQMGVSRDISGHPITSIVQLCALLAEQGRSLEAGSIVLAGAATTAVELKPSLQIELQVQSLAAVRVSTKGSPHES